MPRIEVVEYDRSEGRLREIYDHLIETRGKLAAVHTIQSLNPESIVKHMDLYLEIMYKFSPLKRADRELIATVVSVYNKCLYCTRHHAEALQFYWKDESRLERLVNDYQYADLSEQQIALCDFAKELTLKPGSPKYDLLVDRLKSLSLSDRAILDASLVISYFNFVNRMVMGLGLELEEDGGKGYNF